VCVCMHSPALGASPHGPLYGIFQQEERAPTHIQTRTHTCACTASNACAHAHALSLALARAHTITVPSNEEAATVMARTTRSVAEEPYRDARCQREGGRRERESARASAGGAGGREGE